MQYIAFNLSNSEYSIPILKVREIIKTPSITKMPQTPIYIEGITNIRGTVIPIINLKELINLNSNGNKGDNVIVISSGKVLFGILVDEITGVIDIDENIIERAQKFLNGGSEHIEGIAKLPDRLVVMLDTKNLLPVNDISLFDDIVSEIKEKGEEVIEVTKSVQTMAGEVKFKEICDAKTFFEQRGIDSSDSRYVIFDDIINFIEALSEQDYQKADLAVQKIIKKGQNNLYTEVGRITRKLHDSLKNFKEAIDPRVKEMATVDMPNAIDRLQFVIEKTEEAANKTLGIVEQYILKMDDLSSHIRNIKGSEESIKYLKEFKNKLEDDFTEIITTQSFQDITGQILKKVINLVGEIEEELVSLITNFGVKIDQDIKEDFEISEKVSQNDVDELLKEFGF
ncbi:MAG: protein phosphatase CheZ [Nitrospirae bacterium]|jgi:chemotaxis protein CheZ|nr:protein phosphatase CheZ [Nitrospirota bacterium]